jgi:hypothetical protein
MRPRRPSIHKRSRHFPARLGEVEESSDLRGGGEWVSLCVCYGCAEGFGVVFDFVFFLVEFVFAEEVVYGFVVLKKSNVYVCVGYFGGEGGVLTISRN